MADVHRPHRAAGLPSVALAGFAAVALAVLVRVASVALARVAAVALGVLIFLGLLLGASHAQAPPDSAAAAEASPDTVDAAPDSATAPGPNTRGAFLRGVVLPGWGHTISGATGRGAFYFGAESLAGWMLFKTRRRLTAAREQASLLESRITAQLAAQGVTAPEEVEQALEGDEEVARARGLVSARENQQEDWLAPVIFIMLVSGVDAFVSAHLQDFPEPLTIEGDPSTGRVEVSIRVPLGWKRPRPEVARLGVIRPGATPATRGVRAPRTRR